MDEEKLKFLNEFGSDYGYPNSPKNIDQIRSTEFKRLQDLVYLDHAGATLYSELQMESVLKDLNSNVYGNPHSQSDSGSATSEIVRAARQQVLDYCNASPNDYKCIFTSGATSALKLVGECFPWSDESCFMYTMENHNSVLGIREYALNNGAMAFAVDVEEFESCNGLARSISPSIGVTQHPVQRRSTTRNSRENTDANSLDTCHNLFAFPSECNFSGMKFSLDLVKSVKEDSKTVLEGLPCSRGRWMVLIDAAKGCATEPPNLAEFPADFVAISFYKIFGYPTGLGALIVRTEAAQLLRKKYFSGGTVAASIADIDFYRSRESIEESFEDGTQSFLNIAAIRHGFKIIETLTVSAIARHAACLATYVRNTLLSMRHVNGASVSVLYGGDTTKIRSFEFGPTIAFNLKHPDGSWVGYREVEKLASLSGIQLRTGCFCNPGACSKYLGLSHMDLLSNIEAGHVCWDDHDILRGKPTGAVRVSFGYMSTFEDAKELVHFIKRSFVALPKPDVDRCISNTKSNNFSTRGVYLKSISVYPIKSCGGFSVDSWPLSPSGLLHDREWLLKSPSGDILTQKKVPQMSLISTSIDLTQGTMSVESPNCEKELQINLVENYNTKEEMLLQSQRYEVQGYDTEINLWFTKAVSRPCSLLRCFSSQSFFPENKNSSVETCRDVHSKLNFVNEAQFLLISEDSISDLNTRLSSKDKSKGQDGELIHITPRRFRPNLVISGAEPYEEDNWTSLTIGNAHFTSFGGCNRCQMINLDPDSGQVHKTKEPLATLASFRRTKGKIMFGILLRYDIPDDNIRPTQELQVGHRIYIEHHRFT
ncbi:molybdenum cofactor sulfurtransferase [Ranunculus cassubicifolius]